MITDPLLIAAIAALIGVLFQALYERWKHKSRRKSGKNVLRHQLENQKIQIGEFETIIREQQVFSGLDPTAITSFINSDIVDLSKDEKLLSALYSHLDNIGEINRASDNMNMHGIGGTDFNKHMHLDYELRLRNGVEKYTTDIDTCLNLL